MAVMNSEVRLDVSSARRLRARRCISLLSEDWNRSNCSCLNVSSSLLNPGKDSWCILFISSNTSFVGRKKFAGPRYRFGFSLSVVFRSSALLTTFSDALFQPVIDFRFEPADSAASEVYLLRKSFMLDEIVDKTTR